MPQPTFHALLKQHLVLAGCRDFSLEEEGEGREGSVLVLETGPVSLIVAKRQPVPDTPDRGPRFIIWDPFDPSMEETYSDFSAFLVGVLRRAGGDGAKTARG